MSLWLRIRALWIWYWPDVKGEVKATNPVSAWIAGVFFGLGLALIIHKFF